MTTTTKNGGLRVKAGLKAGGFLSRNHNRGVLRQGGGSDCPPDR
jgi:hypothetical protein